MNPQITQISQKQLEALREEDSILAVGLKSVTSAKSLD